MKPNYYQRLAEYILETERENYIIHCEENGLALTDLVNNNHVYAMALLALGWEWEDN